VDRALAKRRDDRWSSIIAFRDALQGVAITGAQAVAAPAVGDARISVAVLPFANVGGSAENEFFSDGLTEEVIGALARLPRLRVVSRNSAFSFRGRDVPLAEIGAQLRVGFVLTGSVRRSGERLRLSAHLSRVADDTMLWSETYERRMADVFDVQDELSRRIVGTVREALGNAETSTPAPVRHPRSVTAYDQYLQGRHHWNKRGAAALREGMACFQRAIEADATFAPAFAGLADSYALLASSETGVSAEMYARAREAALKAIALDPLLAEGYASLGFVKLQHDWDMEGAGRDLRRATELNPSYVTAWQWYASYLRSVARFDEAIAASHQALALDPFSVATSIGLGISHFFAGDLPTAAAQFERAIAMEPLSVDGYTWLASTYHALERFEKAAEMARRAGELLPEGQARTGTLATMYAGLGRHDEARELLGQMLVAPATSRFFVALIYSFLGETDEVYRWLNLGVDERAPFMYWIRTYPLLSREWGNPRFAAVLERMGLGPPLLTGTKHRAPPGS
jgi:TolB-like protein/Flp pilus assembly protein TadD